MPEIAWCNWKGIGALCYRGIQVLGQGPMIKTDIISALVIYGLVDWSEYTAHRVYHHYLLDIFCFRKKKKKIPWPGKLQSPRQTEMVVHSNSESGLLNFKGISFSFWRVQQRKSSDPAATDSSMKYWPLVSVKVISSWNGSGLCLPEQDWMDKVFC